MKKILNLALIFTLVLFISACNPTTTPLDCEKGYELNKDETECIQSNVTEEDTTAPVITGVTDASFEEKTTLPDLLAGITATDDVDGNVTDSLTIDLSAVDMNSIGEYTVIVTASDSSGNEATEAFTITVTEHVLSDQEKAELDMAEIDLTIDGNKINFPRFGANGTMFYWTSSNQNIVTNNGFIIPPPVGSDTVEVSLDLRVQNGTYNDVITYPFVIEPNEEVTVTSQKEVTFTGTSEEYVVTDKTGIDLYYVDNGNLPYIDIETFITMIDGAIESNELAYTPVGEDILEITYDVEWEDFDGTMVTETSTAVINFTENTFTVNNFSFFENYIASTSSDYGEGLNYVNADYVDGEEVTIPLGDYNFDILTYDDEGTQYLMPLHITNLLFAGNIYYDVYYNSDELYGIDTFGVSGGGEEATAIQEQVRTSSANAEDAPEDIKWATYHFLALALDYFYGLKEDRKVETYYNLLSVRAEDLIDSTENEFYNKIYDIAYDLDDLHTSFAFKGYYYDDPASDTSPSLSDFGPRTTGFYEGLWAVQDLLEDKYGSLDNKPDHRIIDDGKTAVIYLDGFSIDTPNEFKAILDGLSQTVENVVIDLSYNTGGNLGAVLRIFGYMTETAVQYHSQNPADGSAVTYYIESDYVAYNYNWYIISSSVTFSAANLMTSMAKELDIATVMGQDSSGGASSIGVIVTPDGSVLLISTNNVLSTRVGNEETGYEYLSIEDGIEVDYTMSDVTSDSEIINIINEDQTE